MSFSWKHYTLKIMTILKTFQKNEAYGKDGSSKRKWGQKEVVLLEMDNAQGDGHEEKASMGKR
jgi:hypothetical protein